MRTRIIMQKPKYSVNTDNKVVVCTIKCELDLSTITNRVMVEDLRVFNKLPMIDDYGCFTVKAKSRCHPSDTFDIVKGRRIAESKAKIKAFHIAARAWSLYARYYMDILDNMDTLATNCAYIRDAEINHVNELCK